MSGQFMPVFAATPAQTGSGDGVFISLDGQNYKQIMATDNMDYSGQKINFDNTTNTTSPGGVEEFVPTTESPGNFTFEIVQNPNDPGQQMLAAARIAKQVLYIVHSFKALTGFTAGPTNAFIGYVEEFPEPGSSVSKSTKRKVSIKISGLITRTAAVSA